MKIMKIYGLVAMAVAFTLSLSSCSSGDKNSGETGVKVVKKEVTADIETAKVTAGVTDDAADDPAIWVDFDSTYNSMIIGTDKTQGLVTYDLSGQELGFYSLGRVNNVDVTYNFPINGDTIDLVGATNRTTNTLTLMKINKENKTLEEISVREFKSELKEVYGFCFYKSPETSVYYAIMNSKDGGLEQWELMNADTGIDAKVVRSFDVGGQVEGLVADYETTHLYVGEESGGIWKYWAEPDSGTIRKKVKNSDSTNVQLKYDIEGITLYYADGGKGYLIASSQGNNSFALFEREGDNRFIGTFKIVEGLVDGAEDTDGIDVTNIPLGSQFPHGLFVVQDGYNYQDDNMESQNFKFISWKKVAEATEPPLIIDTQYRVEY